MGATSKGTENYFTKHPIHPDKKRRFANLTLSALGAGTYLGDCDDRTDEMYIDSLIQGAKSGINFFDTAINYRFERSEKAVALALKKLASLGISREELVISTKGGYISGDIGSQEYDQFLRTEYFEKKIIEPKDIVDKCHCLTPTFISHQIEKSLENLSIDSIDLYYLHNPEVQLLEKSQEEFYAQLFKVVEMLEKKVEEGKIQWYGFSTWNGFRLKSSSKELLLLDKIMECIEGVAGKNHHFKAIQLPFNLVMLEAMKVKNQKGGDGATIFTAAKEMGIDIFASAPLMQSQVLNLPARIFEQMPKEESAIIKALQFVLSTPFITAAIVGMKSLSHFEENKKALQLPNWSSEQMEEIWKKLGL